MTLSLERIKQLAPPNYFDEGTVEFWGSKILDTDNEHQLFIESIDDFYRTKKLYMVKCISLAGDMITIEPKTITDDAMHFPSEQTARDFREKISRIIPETHKDIQYAEYTADDGVFQLTNKTGQVILLNTNNMTVTAL